MIENGSLKRDLVENVREVLGNMEKLQQMKHNMVKYQHLMLPEHLSSSTGMASSNNA